MPGGLPAVPETMPLYPSGNNAENRRSIVQPDSGFSGVRQENITRRNQTRSLIDSAFPSQGDVKGSHEGSQSMAPGGEE